MASPIVPEPMMARVNPESSMGTLYIRGRAEEGRRSFVAGGLQLGLRHLRHLAAAPGFHQVGEDLLARDVPALGERESDLVALRLVERAIASKRGGHVEAALAELVEDH